MDTHRQSSATSQALDKSMKLDEMMEYVHEDVDERVTVHAYPVHFSIPEQMS
jgi:hypothetical protein